MKHLFIFLALVAISISAFSQQIIPGDKKWTGQQFYTNNIKYDTALLDTTLGYYLKLDTTGMSASGYYTLSVGSGGSGSITGTGSNTKIPIWSGASTLTYDAALGYTSASDRLTINNPDGSIMVGTGVIQARINEIGIEIPENDSVMSWTSNAITTKENLYTNDSTFIDTLVYPTSSHGYALTLDTTGMSSDGYFRIKPISMSSGTVTGSGTSGRVAFWNGASSISSSSSFTWDNTNSRMVITSGVSTVPLQVTGADGDQFKMVNVTLESGAGNGRLIADKSNYGLDFVVNTNVSRLRLGDTQTEFNVTAPGVDVVTYGVSGTPDTATVVDATDKYFGINTYPRYPLSIDAQSRAFLSVVQPDKAPTNSGVGTLNNMPATTSGDPAIYIVVFIDGTRYVMPLWAF